MLDNSRFGALADFLYNRCERTVWEIKARLHHYEGRDDHDWV